MSSNNKTKTKAKRGFRKQANRGLISRIYTEVMTPSPFIISRYDSVYQSVNLATVLNGYTRFLQFKQLFQQFKINYVKVLINPINDYGSDQLEPWKLMYLTSPSGPPSLVNMLSSPSARIIPTNKNSTFTFRVRGRQNDQNYWFDYNDTISSLLLFGSTEAVSENLGRMMVQLKISISYRYPLTQVANPGKENEVKPLEHTKINKVKELIEEVNEELKEMNQKNENKEEKAFQQDKEIVDFITLCNKVFECQTAPQLLENIENILTIKTNLVKLSPKFKEYNMLDLEKGVKTMIEQIDNIFKQAFEHEPYDHTQGTEFIDDYNNT